MFFEIALIVLPLILVGAAGYCYGALQHPDMSTVNRLNMDVFLPCLIFGSLAGSDVQLRDHASLAFGAVVIILLSGLLAWPFAHITRIDAKTFVPPVMFSNAGNLGLPLAVFAFGEQALVAAVLLTVVETGLHFSLGFYILDRKVPIKRIISMPFIMASIAAIALNALDVELPVVLLNATVWLGEIAIPLMLFALGVRIVGVTLNDWRDGILCAVVNPIIGASIALVLVHVLDLSDIQRSMLLIFAVLPPAVLNYLVAELFGQEPRRVAAIVMVGNLTSIMTIPVMLAYVLR